MSTTTTPHGVIVTETENSTSFRLPPWLTDDERARIRSELDQWAADAAVNSSGARARKGVAADGHPVARTLEDARPEQRAARRKTPRTLAGLGCRRPSSQLGGHVWRPALSAPVSTNVRLTA